MISLLVAAQIAAAVPAEPARATGRADTSRFELANGLRVRVQVDRRRPVALVQVTYKVGSLHESAGLTGIAHYVEHMLYRATRNVRNEDAYGYIDRIGGRYTGGTWPEVTKYAELVPSWALESALRITAERMTGALFDSLEFERERSNVIAETNGYADDDPVSALQDAVMQASFELHPYRYNSNTWARDNLALTRGEAFDWYRRHYGPNNAVLTVVGDVNPDSVRTMVARHFAGLARAPGSGRITLVEPPQRAEKLVRVRARGVRPRLEIVYRAPHAAHPDFPALVVLNRVLRARLARALAPSRHDTAFTVADSASPYPYVERISLRLRPGASANALLAIVQREIDAIAATAIGAAELALARRDSGRARRARAEQGGAVPPRRSALSEIADSLTELEPEPWEVSAALRARIAAATQRVTAGEVRDVARRWLRTSQRTVGILEPGADDFEARWSDGRALAGIRPEIPALTVMPAPRERPEPVPPRALERLAPIRIPNARQALPNGVVVRVALSRAASDSAAHVRVAFASRADSLRVAGALARHEVLRRAVGGVRWLRSDTTPDRGPLTVAIAAPEGTITLETMQRALVEALRSLPPRTDAPAPARTHEPALLRVPKDDPQVEIEATLPGIARDHPDRRALELLSYVVGVPSYGGRLGWALTKAGLTYSSSAVASFREGDGTVTIRTTANPSNTGAVIQAITEVVQGVGTRGVTDWELREAQAFMLGRAVLYGAREDSDAAAVAAALVDSELSRLELLDLPGFSRAYLSVTLEELNRVARTYYRADRLRVVATGAVGRAGASVYPPGTFAKLFDQ